MTIQLIKASTLKTRLTNLVSDSVNNTMSLAYYSMINGNVATLKDAQANVSTALNSVYRQFVCAKFDKTTQAWVYDKTKATKLLASLELTFNDCTFEAFVLACDSSVLTKQAVIDDKKAQDEALTPAEIKANHLSRIESYLTAQLKNVSQLELRTIVAKLGLSQAESDKKSIGEVSAA